MANIAYLAARCDIPQDAQMLHLLRISFWTTRSRLTSVIDTMNFVEKFGANMNRVEAGLGEVREMIGDSESLYMNHEYEGASNKINEIDERITELHEETIRLKDRALFWIYLVEWAVTTGSGLLAGFVLWTLMVKRRLYRDVEATRMTTPQR